MTFTYIANSECSVFTSIVDEELILQLNADENECSTPTVVEVSWCVVSMTCMNRKSDGCGLMKSRKPT